MDPESLRKHIPPDWGSPPGAMVADGIWEQGVAGPSDYVRRAWVAGMKDRRRNAGTQEDGEGIDGGAFSGAISVSVRSSRRPSPLSRRISASSVSSLLGDEDEEPRRGMHVEEGIGDKSRIPSPEITRNRRRVKRPIPTRSTSLLPLALLPLLPTASAAPPQFTRPSQSKSPSSAVTPTAQSSPSRRSLTARTKRDVSYPTTASMPAVLPTDLATVDETLLPHIFSKGPDGYWTKNNDGWRLYGRQSGETPVFAPNQPDATATSTWAIEEALPPGWGVQSVRTDLYRVPLIVVASCLIAVGLVVAIIVAALKRKKAHRRAKRRAERQRRRALAAAGLTEEGVNDSRNQEQLREKLDDLQKQHRAKKKGESAVVSSPNSRSRVRSWRAGLLRRRKGKGDGDGDGDGGGDNAAAVVVENKPEDVPVGPDRDSQDTDRSTPTVPSDEPNSGSDGMGSRLNTLSSEESASTNQTTTPDPSVENPSSTLAVPGSSATPYFPPAYRPASVRSFNGDASGSSSQPTSSNFRAPQRSPTLPSVEKVHAPGYYPAPATAEGEAALAVASRSEGKGRMPIPSPELETGEDRELTGHAATDDKLVMERMRMAASAPPAHPAEGEDGPSAPVVEVDRDGFERMESSQPSESPGPSSAQFTLAPPLAHHPALPAPPPRPQFNRSYSIEREVHEQLDELNLLPSAPPALPRTPSRPSPLAHTSSIPSLSDNADVPSAPLPSAPPLMEKEDEDETDGAGPSAPPLHLADEGDEGEEEVVHARGEGIRVAGEPGVDEAGAAGAEAAEADDEAQRRPSEAPSEPRIFLPRYEP